MTREEDTNLQGPHSTMGTVSVVSVLCPRLHLTMKAVSLWRSSSHGQNVPSCTLSIHTPRLKEAGTCGVIRLTGLGHDLGCPSGALGAFLDEPGKRTQWDPSSLSNCQLDAGPPDFSHRFPGFCSLCRRLMQPTPPHPTPPPTTPRYSFLILLQGSGPSQCSRSALPLITMDPPPPEIHLHTAIHSFPGPSLTVTS